MQQNNTVRQPKVICMFNNKGGVGKTTSLVHLATTLAKNHNVLMIDADPQCNLTGYCMGAPGMRDYQMNGGQDIVTCLSPQFIRQQAVVPINPVLYYNMRETCAYLLPGNIGLANYETEFGMSLIGNLGAYCHYPAALRTVIQLMNQQKQYEYVFIDLSPSLGPLNEAILMYCADYFVVPCEADFFSRMAIDGLVQQLPRWRARKNFLTQQNYFANANNMPLVGCPRMLGLFFNKITPSRGRSQNHRNQPSKACCEEMKLFAPHLQAMVNKLAAESMLGTNLTPTNIVLGFIRDFGQLNKLSQQDTVPVNMLSNEELKAFATGSAHNKAVEKADDIDDKIEQILANMITHL